MRALRWMVIAALVHLATAGNASAGANTQLGTVVNLEGAAQKANVLLFFRPDQRNMQDTLKALAACQKELDGKPVRWVGIVPSRFSAEDAKAYAAGLGLAMAVVVDTGDALHAQVGIAMHPSIAILDAQKKLAQFQPYMKLNFCESVMARIKRVLGELDDAALARALDPSGAEPVATTSASKRDVKLAEMLLAGGNVEKALELARKGVTNDPQNAAAHAVLGRAQAASGDCVAARASFEKALKLNPAEAQARAGRDSCAGKK